MAFNTNNIQTASQLPTGLAFKAKTQNSSFDKAVNSPVKNATKRWLCSVSSGVKLSKYVKNGINIDSRGRLSQYELMVKLLKAETCDVIYFDCQLSASQIGILKMLQVFSNTELVHARLAMQFDRAMG